MVDKIRDYQDFKEILSKQNSISESVAKRARKILGEFAASEPVKYRAFYSKAYSEYKR
ncbi:MAG: hypothetical protein IKS60_03570 [Lachnospiraceae bacterium]|jgi:hypothetical protein|nr:hypothetical protein [Lachnospiraceae bacterium]MBR4412669.1 hypothetical protein [Lachnospiraceae bacterium]